MKATPLKVEEKLQAHQELQDVSYSIIKARIGMLATAIGGPDHSANEFNPPYKVGDDCLACIKDLIRWFKLVDDNQKRWDVAMATAEFKILQNDLIPLLVDWETKSAYAAKKSKKTGEDPSTFFKNKGYYDRIALGALQLLVLMTWPLIITDQSSANQINHYFDLKKHQLLYKHTILTTDNGKVLKAAVRLALNIINVDRLDRTARDNSLIRMVIHFFKNVTAIEPGEITISTIKRLKRPLTIEEMLPTNITIDDISINNVITAFHRNKVFGFILTITSGITDSLDDNFLNLPLLELMFFLTKDTNPERFFNFKGKSYQVGTNHEIAESNLSRSGKQLTQLLAKEHEKKKAVIQKTSSRHSRFGGLLSIKTPQHTRLTVASNSVTMNDDAALQELDSRKKWNKGVRMKLDVIEGLSSSFLNNEGYSYILKENLVILREFLNRFVDSCFNTLLQTITDDFTSEIQDQISLHKIEYMLFISWFVKYQRIRCKHDETTSAEYISGTLLDTCFILFTKYLREAHEQKNWAVVHAGMLLFTEYFTFLLSLGEDWRNDVNFIISKLLSENMLQLLASLPKTATSHSSQYVKACVRLTHIVLKTIECYDENKSLKVEAKRKKKISLNHLDVEKYANENELDYEEAFDILESEFRQVSISFDRIFRGYLSESTITTYIRFLQSYKELEDDDLIKVLKFLQRVFFKSKEEALLYRIDFFILLKELLSPSGLPTASFIKSHFNKFSDYFLSQFRKKLKISPSWYVNILFPLLHDSQMSHYMKYGSIKQNNDRLEVVNPSVFVNIQDEEAIAPNILLDMKIGILVSSLIDDGYEQLIDSILMNLRKTLTLIEGTSNNEILSGKHIYTSTSDEIKRSLLQQADFRNLLNMCGFTIPQKNQSHCYLPENRGASEIERDIQIINTHKSVPYVSESGNPPSYYLSNGDYESAGSYEDFESENNNNDYFQDLETMDEKIKGREISKGRAKAKKTKIKPPNLSKKRRLNEIRLNTNKDENTEKSKSNVLSTEYIIDSDDEDIDFGPIFFENESYLRFLLDKFSGTLTPEQYSRFGQFSKERMENSGKIFGDYSDLFGDALSIEGNVLDTEIKGNKFEKPTTVSSGAKRGDDQLSSEEYNSDEFESEDSDAVIKPMKKKLKYSVHVVEDDA